MAPPSSWCFFFSPRRAGFATRSRLACSLARMNHRQDLTLGTTANLQRTENLPLLRRRSSSTNTALLVRAPSGTVYPPRCNPARSYLSLHATLPPARARARAPATRAAATAGGHALHGHAAIAAGVCHVVSHAARPRHCTLAVLCAVRVFRRAHAHGQGGLGARPLGHRDAAEPHD